LPEYLLENKNYTYSYKRYKHQYGQRKEYQWFGALLPAPVSVSKSKEDPENSKNIPMGGGPRLFGDRSPII
jgi:hypothetical protein